MSGDNRYLKMTDAEKKDAAKGKFDERKVQYGNVNWGSIDTKYEDEVARILRERLAQLQEEKKSNKNVIGNLFRGDLYFGQKKGKG